MTNRATRSELATALAKAIAYRDCGKTEDAASWAAKLVKLLEAEEILRPEYRSIANHGSPLLDSTTAATTDFWETKARLPAAVHRVIFGS